jgi:hypothetical protein
VKKSKEPTGCVSPAKRERGWNRGGAIRRWQAILSDRIRYSGTAQRVSGLAQVLAAFRHRNPISRYCGLARAHRILLPAGGCGWSETLLKRAAPGSVAVDQRSSHLWRNPQSGWSKYIWKEKDGLPAISHGLILKPPISTQEKGILVVWVEYNLAALLRSNALAAILNHYQIIFSTSWSPPDFALIWALASEPNAELFIIGSNAQDAGWLQQIPARLSVLPFYASHWICGDDYQELLGSEKTYDFCLVANWAPFKRHWSLFQALRQMPDDLRLALIGQPEGQYTVDSTRALAKAFGVCQQIDWFNRLGPTEVHKIQAESRCGLMMSLREGSCLAVVESLLADSPVGMFENAHVGSLDFIQKTTGVRLNSRRTAQGLMELLHSQKQGRFAAREWALQHAEARLSSQVLNAIFRDNASNQQHPWTLDLLPFCLRSARPDFIDRRHWLEAQSWHDQFEAQYNVRFLWPDDQGPSVKIENK